jgi:hypothetical protein
VSAIFNGNVGIGTSTPTYKLDLNVTSNTDGFLLKNSGQSRFIFTGDAVMYWGASSANGFLSWDTGIAKVGGQSGNVLSLQSNGSEKVRIATDGNVGIGTTSPISLLDVRSGYVTAGTGVSTSGTTILAGYYTSGHLTVLGTEQSSGGPVLGYAVTPSTSTTGAFLSSTTITIPRSAYTQDGGTHRWFTGPSQTVAIGSAVTSSEKMRLDTNGNLGIGTSSPATLLHVDTAGADARIRVSAGTNTVQGGMIANSGTSLIYAGSITNHGFSLRTNDTDRVRIDTSGNVGIGTSTLFAKFVVSNGSGENIEFTPGNATVNGGLIESINRSSGTTRPDLNLFTSNGSNGSIKFYTNGVNERMRITAVGNVGIGTTSVNAGLEVVNSSRMRGILRPANAPTGSFFNESFTLANDGGAAQGYIYSSIPQTGASFPFDAFGEVLIQGNPRSGYNNGISIITGTGTSQTVKFRVQNDGNVGIGTTSPTGGGLHIYGNNAATAGVRLQSSNGRAFDIGSTGTSYGSANNLIIYDVTAASERMRLDSNGNVGIGTTTVDAKLRVLGNVRATSFTGSFSGSVVGSNMFVQGGNSFGTTAILGTSDNQALILETNNSEKLRITTAGNVGIGTSSPTAKLQIGTQTYSTAPDANYFVVGNDNFSGTGPVGAISGYPATANRNQVTASLFDVVGGWEAGNGIHALLRVSAYDKITTTPALVVLNNGNVGIGTNTPNALGGLHVYKANSGGLGGYVILDNNGLALANETALMFGDGGTSSIRAAISSTTEDSPYYGDIKFKTGNSVYSSLITRMIVKGNGNVGIGTTSPFSKLDVRGNLYVNYGSNGTGVMFYLAVWW